MPKLHRLPRAWIQRLRRLGSDRRGATFVELALVMPVVIVLILGCYDAVRYVLINQKLDRISSTMADLVAQPDVFTAEMVDPLFPAAGRLMRPFDLEERGRVIVSEIIGMVGDVPLILWQREGAGALQVDSLIGLADAVADLPDSITGVPVGQKLIVAEAFYDYEPFFFGSMFQSRVISQQSFRMPRKR